MSNLHTDEEKKDLQVSLWRAGSVGGKSPPILVIQVVEQISDNYTLKDIRQLFATEAETLADALLASLPGGTIDALLVELMRRKASLFAVPL